MRATALAATCAAVGLVVAGCGDSSRTGASAPTVQELSSPASATPSSAAPSTPPIDRSFTEPTGATSEGATGAAAVTPQDYAGWWTAMAAVPDCSDFASTFRLQMGPASATVWQRGMDHVTDFVATGLVDGHWFGTLESDGEQACRTTDLVLEVDCMTGHLRFSSASGHTPPLTSGVVRRTEPKRAGNPCAY